MPGPRSWVAIAFVVLAACGQGEASPAGGEPRRYTAADLPEVVVRPTEAPAGTEFVEELSGPFQLDELWPSSCCPAQQQDFEEAGFRAAYGTLFEKPGHSGDPIDSRPGLEVVSSIAVLFSSPQGASEAMVSWIEYFESPVLDPLPTEGLGDEAVALSGSPNAPAETLVLYWWRIGRLLLNLRVSGGTGSFPVGDVRVLADLMHARAS